MNNYSPKITVTRYRVESHCPACIGRALGWLRVPGFRQQIVNVACSDRRTSVLCKDWNGHWDSIMLDAVEPTRAALDSLVRRFM